MPSPFRNSSAVVGTGRADDADLRTARRRAVDVLLAPALSSVVDLVAWVEDDELHVANTAGHAVAAVGRPDDGFTVLSGVDPVADQDPLHGTPLAAALADPSPPAARNAYPHALPRLLSAFADPDRSPDLHVVHTAGHHWPERGGHLGEHGSLDAGQSRAPLVLSGRGVRLRGVVAKAARLVDVGPTLAALAGCDVDGGAFADADGRPLVDLLEPGDRPRHVLGLLWDGTNSNDLLDLAARGELPAVARLLQAGGALQGGAIAEFPSVTLVNHTSALTGVGPGRHGIVGNVYYDPAGDPHATQEFVATDPDYAWGTQVDAFGLAQMLQIVSGDNPQWPVPPRLTWWNSTLTDSAHHAGGPYSPIARASLSDADRRLGVVLDVLEARGLLGDTAVLLTADHGSEGADPSCVGDWDDALRAAGIRFRDEGYGAIYLDVD